MGCKIKNLWGLAIAITMPILATPATAAERVTIKLGAFESAIAISEIEQFAKTGVLPPKLQIYSSLLTPQVRKVLNNRLQVDPKLADEYVANLSSSPYGKQLLKYLGVAIPDLTMPQLQAAVTLAAQQANGVSIVSLIKAYPQENIVIDATSAIALAVEFNPTYLQSQAVGASLEDKLAVTSSATFKSDVDPAKIGKATVKEQTIRLQDRQRDRSIALDIYYPQQNLSSALRPTPLVVISPGLGANRQFFSYLARHLASHGLTVAALEHPDRTSRNVANLSSPNKLLPATEFINRPKDISFVLDQLTNLNKQPGLLQGKLNTETVSIIGHSLGGYTALALVGGELNLQQLRQSCKNANPLSQAPADWLQCGAANLIDSKVELQDRRVKSAIALNPVVGQLFGENGLNKVSVPVLILASTEDAITPVLNHQLRPFTQLLGTQKYLVTAIGGTHLSVGNPSSQAITDVRGIKERRGVEAQPLRQLVSGVSLAFINQLTPKAKIYQPFLTPAYAQSLSSPNLPLRLSTDLPSSIIDRQ